MKDTAQPDRACAAIGIELLGGFRVVVDGEPRDADVWTRRHGTALVKLLAMAPERRLHREQVIDALWPDELVREAAPKLHKASHYARRGLGVPDALVVRGESLVLCPDHDVSIDLVEFEDLARQALASHDRQLAAKALELHRGELLPEDRYEDWVAGRREQVAARHVDLLRLDERWETLIELDPSDEAAHVALMRRHAVNGDRHAALRQYERLDRHLRRELGVGPGREATHLRDELLAAHGEVRRATPDLVGRERELQALGDLVAQCGSGDSAVVFVSGPAGIGKSALLDQLSSNAASANFRVAHGVAASVEGTWPYATVVEALADLCRQHPALLDGLADTHRAELDRALSGTAQDWTGESTHQRLFVAAVELVRMASATSPLLLVLDDLHDADDASLRLLHYIARSVPERGVLIALGHRDEFDAPTLDEIRSSLVSRHGAVDIVVAPLGVDDARRIAAAAGGGGLDEATVDRIVELAGGVPFAVCELARRAASQPGWALELDAYLVAGVDPTTREVLQRVAVVGSTFDTDEFVALSGRDELDAYDALDRALTSGILEPIDGGYRFRHGLLREALVADVPPHRLRLIHRDAAARLIAVGAAPARIGHHLMAAGAVGEAVPHLLAAAETSAAIGAYRDALTLVDQVRPHAVGAERVRALSLRGDLLNALGDPMAASAYREALDGASDADVRRLRTLLARTAVMSGDLDTAAVALDGLELDGGEHDADILLARGSYAFFSGDFDGAAAAADAAEQLVLSGQQNWKVLDLVSLQGLLAHQSGTWFDRIRLELRRTRTEPEIAKAIFDGHLCATEYMLYGPTPYEEVIEVSRDLKRTAQRSGALRAAAFAAVLIGEAALLSGDLDLALAELTEAADLHRDLGSNAGEAVARQRLAEVHIARGEQGVAVDLLHEALPIARTSLVANHLIQRIFGSLIVAQDDPARARVVVDQAELTIGWDESCDFCAVMMAVPATIACARAGDLEHAHRHLDVAARSGALWQGTSWDAAVEEARAAVALAEGERDTALELLSSAMKGFARAGQPLDAERCRLAVSAVTSVTSS